MTADSARVRELGRDEVDGLLARNRVGRLAYVFHNQVDVETIPYVYEAPWIYGRARPGLKLGALEGVRFITFEVDEVASPEEWRSVTVRAALYLLADADTPREHGLYERARALVDRALPQRGDVGARGCAPLFRIPAHHAVGSACELCPGAAPEA
jgi:nitroimidazol reductase NimA-like FMN-containing flavoprotein (pyridoxamine 5'-phosphate oxidase superfamily)